MSSEESLSTRLRPGVTTKLGKARAANNLQDDLMRLIDPDIAESDLAGLLVRTNHLSKYLNHIATMKISTTVQRNV